MSEGVVMGEDAVMGPGHWLQEVGKEAPGTKRRGHDGRLWAGLPGSRDMVTVRGHVGIQANERGSLGGALGGVTGTAVRGLGTLGVEPGPRGGGGGARGVVTGACTRWRVGGGGHRERSMDA